MPPGSRAAHSWRPSKHRARPKSSSAPCFAERAPVRTGVSADDPEHRGLVPLDGNRVIHPKSGKEVSVEDPEKVGVPELGVASDDDVASGSGEEAGEGVDRKRFRFGLNSGPGLFLGRFQRTYPPIKVANGTTALADSPRRGTRGWAGSLFRREPFHPARV